MAGYTPLYISKMETGLVQSRQEFILPNDAYPILENAFVWRERIKRRQGLTTLGRLQRDLTVTGVSGVSTTFTINLFTLYGITEPNAELVPGTIFFSIAGTRPASFQDNGDGSFTVTGNANGDPNLSFINYLTGSATFTFILPTLAGAVTTNQISYSPGLPVMGLRTREINTINVEQLIAFDTIYAYIFNSGSWEEFIPGTVWTGTDANFFWSTNYWIADNNAKVFWVTNFSGAGGDPIRYTNGTTWIDFEPTIDAVGTKLTQCLAMLPFRGRMVTFNTLEGATLGASIAFTNRIRWSAIGTPFSDTSSIVTNVNANAWRDDIRGQGGFLDIPTSEDIISVGFVRDNLVIYCERSTWQLRYTGRSIAPFQIEKVNSELGAESTFSAVQFDTSLVGIGDKGVVECDSFKSERIDIKIPDLVFEFNNANDGTSRVHGIRDFQQRLAYWTYPYGPGSGPSNKFPNRRLVYNYENDSWAIFTDSLTCFGTYQPIDSERWQDFNVRGQDSWQQSNFAWTNFQEDFPAIVAGNQQGFVMYLSSNLQPEVSNDVTLTLTDIVFDVPSGTNILTSVAHNLVTGQVIMIQQIPLDTPYSELNEQKFGIVVIDADTFQIWSYSSATGQFSIPSELNEVDPYIGGGKIAVLDGFSITSKKFNFLEDGQNIQLGYLDILMDNTENGAITLNVYQDYNDSDPVNQLGENVLSGTTPAAVDSFFNGIVPTSNNGSVLQSTKNWQRVYCPSRGSFITIEWTLSNAQLVGPEQESNVQIDAQILYLRRAGRALAIGAA